jgi:hypothetical protein
MVLFGFLNFIPPTCCEKGSRLDEGVKLLQKHAEKTQESNLLGMITRWFGGHISYNTPSPFLISIQTINHNKTALCEETHLRRAVFKLYSSFNLCACVCYFQQYSYDIVKKLSVMVLTLSNFIKFCKSDIILLNKHGFLYFMARSEDSFRLLIPWCKVFLQTVNAISQEIPCFYGTQTHY